MAGGCGPGPALALLLGLAGCVTTYEDAPLLGEINGAPAPAPAAASLTIPFGGDEDQGGVLAEFYRNVLLRMQEAAAQEPPDLLQLETLLASYERPDLPPSILQHVRGYRSIAIGLRFLQAAKQQTKLVTLPPASPDPQRPEPIDGVPVLGQPIELELQLAAGAEPVRLGGEADADPVRFSIAVTIDDTFVDGSTQSLSRPSQLSLPATFDLAGAAVLRLPLAIDLEAGAAVRRSILVRVDLMPGYVTVGEQRVPIRRTRLVSAQFDQWPAGFAALAKAPLAELRQALQRFEPKQFPRAYLAALRTPAEQRPEAVALLIEQVRFGRSDQAQVAMAALRAITGVEVPIGDREGWLAWWQQRR